MSFVSLAFAVLYAAALVLRFATRQGGAGYVLGLLALSWTFYAWHVPHYLALILISTSVDYAAARFLAATAATAARRRFAILLTSLVLNLGLLGYFKYAGFLVRTLADLARRSGSSSEPAPSPTSCFRSGSPSTPFSR